jgi:hypothetical protein
MDRKAQRAWTLYNLFNDARNSAHFTAASLDNDELVGNKAFIKSWNKFQKRMREIDEKFPCPSIHEFNE